MIQEDFYNAIVSDGNFANTAANRLYPLRMPRGAALPAAVYQLITNEPIVSMDGDSNLDNIRMQVTVWAKTYLEAVQLAAYVRNAVTSEVSLNAFTESVIDTEDQETEAYGVIIDFSLWGEVDEITPTDLEYLLLETGDAFLLETADQFALEG